MSKSTKPRIAIIGAGPAGLSCARYLADAGREMIIIDDRVPWEKPCGGILPPSVCAGLMDINTYPFQCRILDTIKWLSPRDDERIITCENEYAVVSRRDFASYLLSLIPDTSITIVRERVKDIRLDDIWEIHAGRNILSADIVIGADGVNSVVRKAVAGNFPREDLAVSTGYYLERGDLPACVMKSMDLIGYAWLIPAPGCVNAGIMAQCGTISAKNLNDALDGFLRRHMPRASIIRRYSAHIPSARNPSFFTAPRAGKNWILIGDAAGHVDPVMGEGIYYAMKSGELAARAIIAGDPRLFDESWRSTYGETLLKMARKKKSMLNIAHDMGTLSYGAFIFHHNCA